MQRNSKLISLLLSITAISGAIAVKAEALELSTQQILNQQGIEQTAARPTSVQKKALVTATKLLLLSSPSPDAPAAHTVMKGTSIAVYEQTIGTDGTNWYRGKIQDGSDGWFPANTPNVTIISNQPQPVIAHKVKETAPALMQQIPTVITVTPQQPEVSKITRPVENKESRIEIDYNDTPITVPVSRNEINIIRVPYTITQVDTSKKELQEMGRTENELSVSVLRDQNTDLAIITPEKTFIFTLAPVPKSASLVVVRDVGRNRRTDEAEKSHPYVETLISLIKESMKDDRVDGYATVNVAHMVHSPDATFILKKEHRGPKYKIVLIDVLNNTKEPLQIREDMRFIQNIISKMAGKPLAVALTREILHPTTPDSERKGENVSTIYAVVPNI